LGERTSQPKSIMMDRDTLGTRNGGPLPPARE